MNRLAVVLGVGQLGGPLLGAMAASSTSRDRTRKKEFASVWGGVHNEDDLFELKRTMTLRPFRGLRSVEVQFNSPTAQQGTVVNFELSKQVIQKAAAARRTDANNEWSLFFGGSVGIRSRCSSVRGLGQPGGERPNGLRRFAWNALRRIVPS